ncbi:diguanylate cyclase domain-containing protein [Photobacterium phosphoreum]|uniref:diguanylate cyclase domain-containing protein n=1 Tax=Photobacterium phosphoreum TaxID=659 RepID=UPI00338FAE59
MDENNLVNKLNDLLNIVSNEKIENLDITISIGAFITSKKINLSEAFNYADKALYESKNTGRNKYTISEYQ